MNKGKDMKINIMGARFSACSGHEAMLGLELDMRNLRKKVLDLSMLVPLDQMPMVGRHRPAQLFRFDTGKYEKLKKRGFNFEL